MSKYWIEKYDKTQHQNYMWGVGQFPPSEGGRKYVLHDVYFVSECGFTFEFHNLKQLESCRDYYSRKIRPSTIIPEKELYKYGGDHGEIQRWFEKMPKKLNNNHNRPKVLKALNRALKSFKSEIG